MAERELEQDFEARYDAVCKRVLSHKAILARIMQGCLAEYQDCEPDEIAEKYIEGKPQVADAPVLPLIQGLSSNDTSPEEGAVSYDVLFQSLLPNSHERVHLIINLEAQNAWNPGYSLLQRGVYYCSRLLSAQYGREFTHSQYGQLKKVYSIWICMNPPKKFQNTISRYYLQEENLVGLAREPRTNYDLLSVVRICLGAEDGENYQGILKMLNVLFSMQKSQAEKWRILCDDFAIKATQDLEQEVSEMCNLSQGVKESGRMQGVAQGMAQGMAQGKAEAMLFAVKNLMESTNWPAERAMEMLKIPEEDRKKYAKMLN